MSMPNRPKLHPITDSNNKHGKSVMVETTGGAARLAIIAATILAAAAIGAEDRPTGTEEMIGEKEVADMVEVEEEAEEEVKAVGAITTGVWTMWVADETEAMIGMAIRILMEDTNRAGLMASVMAVYPTTHTNHSTKDRRVKTASP